MKFISARKPSLQRAMRVWRASGHFHIKSFSSTLWQNLFKRKRSVALSTVQKYTDCQPRSNYLISLTTSKFGNSVGFFCFSCGQFVNVGMWKTRFTYLVWSNERSQILIWSWESKNLNLSFAPLEQSLWLQWNATLYTIFNFYQKYIKRSMINTIKIKHSGTASIYLFRHLLHFLYINHFAWLMTGFFLHN